MYSQERQDSETFAAYINRIGKLKLRTIVEEYQKVPTYEQDPSYYSDWGDPREYTIDDMGIGECAGEVVSFVQFGLAASEREIFEAQIFLDDGNVATAGQRAYSAMLTAARALVLERNANVSTDAEEVVSEFRRHLYDTQLFFDPFVGGKFAHDFFRIHEEKGIAANTQAAHQMIEEAQLFVDAAHQCYTRHGSALKGPAMATNA